MTSNRSSPISSPDAKKKMALPSILSNLRNAQAVIGRAADELHHDRETRPLVGGHGGGAGGGRMAAASNRPQLQRSAPSALSTTLQNFSQRFGSQWRKRSSRRKKGQGVTVVPQSFYFAVGCFFFAFPLFFILFILARHAVFGDEGDSTSTQAHIHEVPAHEQHISFESGEELVDQMNKIDIDNPEAEIRGVGFGVNQTLVDGAIASQLGDAANDLHHDKEQKTKGGGVGTSIHNVTVGSGKFKSPCESNKQRHSQAINKNLE